MIYLVVGVDHATSLPGTRTSRRAPWRAPSTRPSSAPRPRGPTSLSPRSSGPNSTVLPHPDRPAPVAPRAARGAPAEGLERARRVPTVRRGRTDVRPLRAAGAGRHPVRGCDGERAGRGRPSCLGPGHAARASAATSVAACSTSTPRTARRARTCTPPTSRPARSCSATAPGEGSRRATSWRRRRPRTRAGSASRWSSSPIAWRAGARPRPRGQLDAAWIAVVEHLRGGPLGDLPLVAGGRSSGARVACRTAAQTGAAGVLCLAFPVHPPGRPEKTRLPELDAVAVPTLVVQGASDPFGMPPAGPHRARSSRCPATTA